MQVEAPAADFPTRKKRRIQVTPRAIFAALAIAALFFAALQIPDTGPHHHFWFDCLRGAACGLVTCVALAGLYWMLRSLVPLATMFVGVVVCMLSLLIASAAFTRDVHHYGGPRLFWAVASVAWSVWYGAGISIGVAIVRGLAGFVGRLKASLTGSSRPEGVPARSRGAGWKIGLAMAAPALLIGVRHMLPFRRPNPLGALQNVWGMIHFPLLMPLGELAHVLRDVLKVGLTPYGFFLIAALLCIPYWMGMAWCVRRLADRLAE